MMQPDKQDPPDSILLQRAAKGDAQAFGDLYTRYMEEIQRYIFFRVANRLDAEDLTETVFIKAWEALTASPAAEINNLRGWLYRIAHNQVIDHYRANRATSALPPDQALKDESPSPEAKSLGMDDQRRLAASIQQLEASQQQVIICRFINGLSHAETAQVLNIKEGHVRVLQFRALQRLKEILAQE